jgi:Leucine-rich repeat (LRR) protein
MKHILPIALILLCTATAYAQIDEGGKQLLDSLGIKYDLNDPDAEEKIGKALKEFFTAKMDSAMKVVSNEVVDPYNTGKLAEEILNDFTEGDDTTSTSYEFMQVMPFLLLNLDRPDRRFITDSGFDLPNKLDVLILRGNGSGTPVDFNSLMSELSDGNISELYITNDKGGVSRIPEDIGGLKNLKKLGLFGNNISQLPASIAELSQLEELYIDANPIAELPKSIGELKGLKILGIAQTKINASEKERIQKALPNCKILLQ